VRGDIRHKVWGERVVVRRALASAVTCCAAVVAWGAGAPGAAAFSPPRIYWTNNLGGNTIGEANLDGTAANQSLITGANFPAGVAVDGQHIY
jgi:hypothetical protein